MRGGGFVCCFLLVIIFASGCMEISAVFVCCVFVSGSLEITDFFVFEFCFVSGSMEINDFSTCLRPGAGCMPDVVISSKTSPAGAINYFVWCHAALARG